MARIVASVCVALAACGILVGGCAARRPDIVAYEPPLVMADLAVGLPAPQNGYTLLSDERTVGRFACAMAVARLVPRDGEEDCELVFAPMRDAEQAYWSQEMRGLAALRRVTFVTLKGTRLYGPTFDGVMHAAEQLDISLLLLYARNGLGPNSAQVLGVLYDVPTREPIATFHASSAFLNELGQEVSPDFEEGDHRDIDARYQAQRTFETHVLDCLRELITRDSPPPTTQPHDKWQTPFIERWWMPFNQRR